MSTGDIIDDVHDWLWRQEYPCGVWTL